MRTFIEYYSNSGALLLILAGLMFGCGSDFIKVTGGRIPPRTFQFVEVLPTLVGIQGGWQIACVQVLVGQGLPDKPHLSSRKCQIQPQVPLRNNEGPISRRKAQYASAKAANEAAYTILERTLGVTEHTCKQIRDEMNILLGLSIPGARVTRCIPLKGRNGMVIAPPVIWP